MSLRKRQRMSDKTSIESPSSTNIDSIPDALLLDIFSKLTFEELSVCSRVCHRWFVLTKDFTLQKRIIINKKLNIRQFHNLVEYQFTNLLEEFWMLNTGEEIVLVPMSKTTLWRISRKCRNMKKLVFMASTLTGVSVEDFPRSLIYLSVRGSELYPNDFFGLKPGLDLSNLVCLDVGEVSNYITSQDLHVFNSFKSLRALFLEGCFRVNNAGIEAIIDILPQLFVLDVEHTDITNDGAVTIFANCINIRHLYIGNVLVDDVAFEQVEGNIMTSLTRLCMKKTFITSKGLHTFFSKHPSYHKLEVTANFKFDPGYGHSVDGTRENALVINNYPYTVGNLHIFPIYGRCNHYLSDKLYGLKKK